MPATKKQELGKWGENLAASLLESKGYSILHRNWRWSRAEIDIVACNETFLVFVEVKVRKNSSFGFPEEHVSQQKSKLIRTASEYYQQNIGYSGFVRFDIVSVLGYPDRFEILHLEDAF